MIQFDTIQIGNENEVFLFHIKSIHNKGVKGQSNLDKSTPANLCTWSHWSCRSYLVTLCDNILDGVASDRDGHLIQRCPGDLRLSINCKMWEFRPQHDKLHHYHLFILLATVTKYINSIIKLTRQINTKMKFWRIPIPFLLLHCIIQQRSSDGNPAQSPSS